MAPVLKSNRETPTARGLVVAVVRWLASLKLAVFLLVVLAVVLAWATFVEASRGPKYVQWYFYGSRWFLALWGLLAVNILAATLIRFPWKRAQIGFLITHAGVLVLSVGSMQTFRDGIEGRVSFVEGETADSILLPYRSQLKVEGPGETEELSTAFSFSPGPVDWEPDRPLDFGTVDGVRLRVLAFYPHARREVDWVAADSGHGPAALKLGVTGPGDEPIEEIWCVANPFGSRAPEGKPNLQLQQAPVASMREDFLRPPRGDLPEKGLLSIHYQGQVYPIAVDEHLGEKVPLGDSGVSVEIAGYYANAVFQGGGRFTSRGEAPKNPMLQLEVHLPDREAPIEEIAFAKNPFVSYGLMRGKPCPVKFWYHHPRVSARTGVEFLETPDEKLLCRLGVEGKYRPQGEVKVGDRIRVSEDLQVSLLSHLPHARQEVRFRPAELVRGEAPNLEAAALVELSAGGKTQQVWLKRGDPRHGSQTVHTPEGPLVLSFGYEHLPLGFSLKLLDFQRGMNPGRMGDASFASEVLVVDEAEGVREKRKISMNRPLVQGKFTLYQSSFSELPGGVERSVLSAAYDPGRPLKYLGSVMICLGIFIMYYLKAAFRRRIPAAASPSEAPAAGSRQPDSQTRSASCGTSSLP